MKNSSKDFHQPLGVDEVHIHLAQVPEKPDRKSEDFLRMLPDEEKERYLRFIPDHARLEFLTGRVLLRNVLSRHLHQPAESLVFEKTEHGKLYLPDAQSKGLQFNLSHTCGLAALAVCRERALGIDVESVDPRRCSADVAERFFAPSEVRHMRQISEADYAREFFTIWTLKESYIKARGLGLSIPLDKFSFSLDSGDGLPKIEFVPGFEDHAARWQFRTMNAGKSHIVSLAVAKGASQDLAISLSTPVFSMDAPNSPADN